MTELTIRTARTSDAPAITDILNHEVRSGLAIWRYAEREIGDIETLIQTRLNAKHTAYVAESGQTIIGWASYGPFRSGEGYVRTVEHSVHIHRDYRRRGAARQLMTRLVTHADNADVHVMIGAIESSNQASIALHNDFGFIETGRLPEVGWKFDQWLTLVLMQRTSICEKISK